MARHSGLETCGPGIGPRKLVRSGMLTALQCAGGDTWRFDDARGAPYAEHPALTAAEEKYKKLSRDADVRGDEILGNALHLKWFEAANRANEPVDEYLQNYRQKQQRQSVGIDVYPLVYQGTRYSASHWHIMGGWFFRSALKRRYSRPRYPLRRRLSAFFLRL